MYEPDSDLKEIQRILIADTQLLSLLGLDGKPLSDVLKRITRKNKWDDLMDSDKRLCLYPLRSRGTRTSILFEEIIEIDCHVPSSLDDVSRKVIGRAVDVLNNRRINGRYLTFKGQLGELQTASGFYCFGIQFGYYNPV